MFAGFARDTRMSSSIRLSASRRADSPRWPALNEAFETCTRIALKALPRTPRRDYVRRAADLTHSTTAARPKGGSVPVARIQKLVSRHDTSYGIELQDYSENGITL